jgi:single-stranded-DNA-specific exonuclease
MAEWIQPSSPPVPDALDELVGGNALVARLLAQRGIRSVEEARPFLDPGCYDPSLPEELPDLEVGAARIREAIQSGEKILVWGDFDVDGQTSTALLVEALTELGADVTYHIPHRERESHGVNTEYLRPYLGEGDSDKGVEVVLTCDTGISSHEPLAFAASQGVDVVVTDHHDLPPELPEAKALINPKRLPEEHSLRTLPGVGVAYKFIQALAEGARLDPTEYLDLVALGIVADIAHQRKDTRYLLQRGLEKLRLAQRPGLKAVMENANVTPEAADEEDIGYRIGPRLNAVGRLGDANISVPLLTTSDPSEAKEIAAELEELNDRRKLLTDQVFEAARERIRFSPEILQHAVLVMYGEQWPAGVIGIVAHRLAEEYHKPTILLTSGGDEDSDGDGQPMARGSARSIEDLDISEAIGDHADILESYGGHPMAAGLTLPESEIGRFRRLVSRSIVEQKGGEELVPTLQIDSYVSLEDLTLELADDIRQLAPFGPGNREVILACRNLQVAEVKEIGDSGAHLKVTVTDLEGSSREVLNWNASKEDLPSGVFDLALKISDNVFRGERSLQLTWEDARERRKEASEQEEASSLQVVGHREVSDKASLLREFAQKEGAQVWLEATSVTGVKSKGREELSACEELIVGTIPPSRQVLEEVLSTCEPEILHVVGIDPQVDTLQSFTRRLLGLVKHAVKAGKTPSLSQLAVMMAHEESTARNGLRWLEDRGQIEVSGPESSLRFKSGKRRERSNGNLSQELRRALEEARAFRKYALSGTSLGEPTTH